MININIYFFSVPILTILKKRPVYEKKLLDTSYKIEIGATTVKKKVKDDWPIASIIFYHYILFYTSHWF